VVLITLSKHKEEKKISGLLLFSVTERLLHHNFLFLQTWCWKATACRTFSKCQSYSNENCLSKCTYTDKIVLDNHLHNCVYAALSI